MDNLIVFDSMTEALRARDLLRGRGISSRLVRTPAKLRHGSCGYSLAVKGDYARAWEFLRKNGASLSDVNEP